MSAILKPARAGRFAIEKTILARGSVAERYDRATGTMSRSRLDFDWPVVKLTEDGNTWMSDNPFEVESVMPAIERARGVVLTAGLGIGFIPTMIGDRVTSIDIVELNREVIDLVFHQVATHKMRVIHDDLFHYLRTTDKRYDFIAIDVWQDTLVPLLEGEEAAKLARRCLKPGGEIWCWLQEATRTSIDQKRPALI
jgi:hypothetical protein